MTFQLEGDPYAVDLSTVSHVARSGADGGGEGGGVVDLAARLGLGRGSAPDAPVLILRPAGPGAGVRVRVTALGEVLEIDDREVRDVPRYFSSVLVRGVVEVEGRMLVLLDSRAVVGEGTRAGAGGEGAS